MFGAALSGDGRFAYSVGEHGIVRTWDVATGTEARAFTPPLDFHFNGDQRSVAFSRDGRYVLLGGATSQKLQTGAPGPHLAPRPKIAPFGGRLLLIDLVRDELVPSPSSLKLEERVKSVGLSADGRFAAIATQNTIVSVPRRAGNAREALMDRDATEVMRAWANPEIIILTLTNFPSSTSPMGSNSGRWNKSGR